MVAEITEDIVAEAISQIINRGASRFATSGLGSKVGKEMKEMPPGAEWRTIKGNHVMINAHGAILEGPPEMKGQNVNHLDFQNKHGVASKDIEPADQPTDSKKTHWAKLTSGDHVLVGKDADGKSRTQQVVMKPGNEHKAQSILGKNIDHFTGVKHYPPGYKPQEVKDAEASGKVVKSKGGTSHAVASATLVPSPHHTAPTHTAPTHTAAPPAHTPPPPAHTPTAPSTSTHAAPEDQKTTVHHSPSSPALTHPHPVDNKDHWVKLSLPGAKAKVHQDSDGKWKVTHLGVRHAGKWTNLPSTHPDIGKSLDEMKKQGYGVVGHHDPGYNPETNSTTSTTSTHSAMVPAAHPASTSTVSTSSTAASPTSTAHVPAPTVSHTAITPPPDSLGHTNAVKVMKAMHDLFPNDISGAKTKHLGMNNVADDMEKHSNFSASTLDKVAKMFGHGDWKPTYTSSGSDDHRASLQNAVRNMTYQFTPTDAHSSPQFVALQQLANEAFGLHSWDEKPPHVTQGVWNAAKKLTDDKDFHDVVSQYLKSAHNVMVKHLKDQGITHLTMFRSTYGMANPEFKQKVKDAEAANPTDWSVAHVGQIKLNPLTPFTTSMDVAMGGESKIPGSEKFGATTNSDNPNMLAVAHVPIERVAGSLLGGFGSRTEHGVTVMGKPGDTATILSAKKASTLTKMMKEAANGKVPASTLHAGSEAAAVQPSAPMPPVNNIPEGGIAGLQSPIDKEHWAEDEHGTHVFLNKTADGKWHTKAVIGADGNGSTVGKSPNGPLISALQDNKTLGAITAHYHPGTVPPSLQDYVHPSVAEDGSKGTIAHHTLTGESSSGLTPMNATDYAKLQPSAATAPIPEPSGLPSPTENDHWAEDSLGQNVYMGKAGNGDWVAHKLITNGVANPHIGPPDLQPLSSHQAHDEIGDLVAHYAPGDVPPEVQPIDHMHASGFFGSPATTTMAGETANGLTPPTPAPNAASTKPVGSPVQGAQSPTDEDHWAQDTYGDNIYMSKSPSGDWMVHGLSYPNGTPSQFVTPTSPDSLENLQDQGGIDSLVAHFAPGEVPPGVSHDLHKEASGSWPLAIASNTLSGTTINGMGPAAIAYPSVDETQGMPSPTEEDHWAQDSAGNHVLMSKSDEDKWQAHAIVDPQGYSTPIDVDNLSNVSDLQNSHELEPLIAHYPPGLIPPGVDTDIHTNALNDEPTGVANSTLAGTALNGLNPQSGAGMVPDAASPTSEAHWAEDADGNFVNIVKAPGTSIWHGTSIVNPAGNFQHWGGSGKPLTHLQSSGLISNIIVHHDPDAQADDIPGFPKALTSINGVPVPSPAAAAAPVGPPDHSAHIMPWSGSKFGSPTSQEHWAEMSNGAHVKLGGTWGTYVTEAPNHPSYKFNSLKKLSDYHGLTLKNHFEPGYNPTTAVGSAPAPSAAPTPSFSTIVPTTTAPTAAPSSSVASAAIAPINPGPVGGSDKPHWVKFSAGAYGKIGGPGNAYVQHSTDASLVGKNVHVLAQEGQLIAKHFHPQYNPAKGSTISSVPAWSLGTGANASPTVTPPTPIPGGANPTQTPIGSLHLKVPGIFPATMSGVGPVETHDVPEDGGGSHYADAINYHIGPKASPQVMTQSQDFINKYTQQNPDHGAIAGEIAKRMVKMAPAGTFVKAAKHLHTSADTSTDLNAAKAMAKAYISNWNGSSTAEHALAAQQSAAEVFGTHDWSHKPNHIESGTWSEAQQMRSDPAYKAAADAFIKSQYDHTQAYLKARGITHLIAYRGQTSTAYKANKGPFPHLVPHLDQAIKDHASSTHWATGGISHVATNPVSSWSLGTHHGGGFAGATTAGGYGSGNQYGVSIAAVVPRERIMSLHQTGMGTGHENEATILGGPNQQVSWGAGHTGGQAVAYAKKLITHPSDLGPAGVMGHTGQPGMKSKFAGFGGKSNTPLDGCIYPDINKRNADWIKTSWTLPETVPGLIAFMGVDPSKATHEECQEALDTLSNWPMLKFMPPHLRLSLEKKGYDIAPYPVFPDEEPDEVQDAGVPA